MRKKTSPTIVERATVLPEFQQVVSKPEQQVTLRGQSQSTLNNYVRRIALCVLHFGRLPEQVSEDEANEYLAALTRDPKSPSRSSFKHMVYVPIRLFNISNFPSNRQLAVELAVLQQRASVQKTAETRITYDTLLAVVFIC